MGSFNLYNLLASVGAVLQLKNDFKIEDILEKITNFRGVVGRMELLSVIEKNGHKMQILSDYAHTPDAVENVLRSLSGEKYIIALIGAGGDRDKSKRPLMAKKAWQNSDFLFLTSDNPRSEEPEDILKDMEEGISGQEKYDVILDRKEAINKAIELGLKKTKGKDVVLAILGKGDENYMEIKGKKVAYSDREVVDSSYKLKVASCKRQKKGG
jgi:UDP-N-acetylmuramoyl-L-alanyl-D-glutamate--2,6-diaminopimelate ligase